MDKLPISACMSSGAKAGTTHLALEPSQAARKSGNLAELYGEPDKARELLARPSRFYDDDQKVKPFQGTHPAVMRDTVAAANWSYTSRNPLIRFRSNYFWEDIALIIRRCMGITLGVHKNYRLIK